MARGARGGSHAARRPVDLTGIISVAEKNDLFTLVNAITEKMLRDVNNLFDSPPITPIQGEHDHHYWLLLPLLHDKENRGHFHLSSKLKKGNELRTFENTHQLIEKEEKEAMTPQLVELKKEALLYFRKWQSNVLQRLRDVTVREVTVNELTAPTTVSRGRGRGSRNMTRGRGGRGGVVAVGPLHNPRAAMTLATGPPRAPTKHLDRALASRYPPIPNSLWDLEIDKRKQLQHIILLLLLSLQEYNPNSRLLLIHLASSLNLPSRFYQEDELRLAQGFARTALSISAEDAAAQKPDDAKSSKRWKLNMSSSGVNPLRLANALLAVGIGTVQGGSGLTPATAASLLGVMSDNAILMGSIFGINANKPTSKVIESFTREIQDFAFLPLYDSSMIEYHDARDIPAAHRRFRLTVTLNGFLVEGEDVTKPWRCLGRQTETFTARWEVNALTNLGNSLETVIKSRAWKNATEEIQARTIFASLADSVWPLSLLKISKIMDNPWSVGMVRAEKAGAVLADAIMRQRFHGDRPISLIGYSLGARSIYTCLMVLAERRQFGLIDSVVLIGTPAPSESRVWLTLKSVVCGRLINVYSEHDYILGFLYRTSNIQFGVAGLQEIQGADGVENHSIRHLHKGHLSYQNLVGQILRDVGWEDFDCSLQKAERNSVLKEVKL